MAIVTIKIVDENPERYTLKANTHCLGRMWDNIAEGVKVVFPKYEVDNGHSCTMIVYFGKKQIASYEVENGQPIDITDLLSRHPKVRIGFLFVGDGGYKKNSAVECFFFAEALEPQGFIPEPDQKDVFKELVDGAFVRAQWSQTASNTINFINLNGDVVSSLRVEGGGGGTTDNSKWFEYDIDNWEQLSQDSYRLSITKIMHRFSMPIVETMYLYDSTTGNYENTVPIVTLLPNDTLQISGSRPVKCKILIKGEIS